MDFFFWGMFGKERLGPCDLVGLERRLPGSSTYVGISSQDETGPIL